jgi:hypothetical protein
MLRPYTIYISKPTMDMLRAWQQLTNADSRDELADGLLFDALKVLPGIQQMMDLQKESRKELERKQAELVRQLKP